MLMNNHKEPGQADTPIALLTEPHRDLLKPLLDIEG
jgi:hypothetical protein